MKLVKARRDPVNVLTGKDRSKGLYEVLFDHRQENPRVALGSSWIGHDERYDRRFLFRVIDHGYDVGSDVSTIVTEMRNDARYHLDDRAREFFCAEKGWMRLEGEIRNGRLVSTSDLPTVLQTFLTPVGEEDEYAIAASDSPGGFEIGRLQNGRHTLSAPVCIPDRFVGERTAIVGASGSGKSTLVRGLARHWLLGNSYGKLIDDLKGEYVFDTVNERREVVAGLSRHPSAGENLFLFTTTPGRYATEHDAADSDKRIGGIQRLTISLNDVPARVLPDIATHFTDPQWLFLSLYQDRPGILPYLARRTPEGDVDTSGWFSKFKGYIVRTKQARERFKNDPDLAEPDAVAEPGDVDPSAYRPILGVVRQVWNLASRPYVSEEEPSCLPRIRQLLSEGRTVVIDKFGLTDEDRIVISSVIARHLYDFNHVRSSGSKSQQAEVVPFVYLVEEAHLLLSPQRVREGSVFAEVAKTGRSFQIGLISVTQRPSSIDDSILSQCNNFVALRLPYEDDRKHLLKATGGAMQSYENEIGELQTGVAVVAFSEQRPLAVKVMKWTPELAECLAVPGGPNPAPNSNGR